MAAICRWRIVGDASGLKGTGLSINQASRRCAESRIVESGCFIRQSQVEGLLLSQLVTESGVSAA